jgi:hypothetical protein
MHLIKIHSCYKVSEFYSLKELEIADFVDDIQDVYQPLTDDHILQIRCYANKDRYGHQGQIKVENVRLDELFNSSDKFDYMDFINKFHIVTDNKIIINPIEVLMKRIGY